MELSKCAAARADLCGRPGDAVFPEARLDGMVCISGTSASHRCSPSPPRFSPGSRSGNPRGSWAVATHPSLAPARLGSARGKAGMQPRSEGAMPANRGALLWPLALEGRTRNDHRDRDSV